MTTPFTFFRRNQQVLMVGVVILSMVAFTIGDAFSNRESQFVMLGIMLGGIVFAFTGIPRGKWASYGLGGAVLGGLLGWILPGILAPIAQSARTSTIGTFDRNRLTKLADQRNLANAFMAQTFEQSIGPGMGRYAPQFRFYDSSEEDDLIFAELMRAEADRLGIVVTNSMVSDFINRQTNERLSAEQFAAARKAVGLNDRQVTEAELFDALREQIKARLAFIQLSPQSAGATQSPEVYYSMFRRTKITQRLNTVRLDVDDFLDQVPEPSDADITTLFEENRLKMPGDDAPGSPGFRQPGKARIAWLELSYKDVEARTPAPTDTEILEFYDRNKDSRYRKAPETAPPAPTPAAPTPAAPATGTTDPAAPTTGTTDPAAPPATDPAAAVPEATPAGDSAAPAASEGAPATPDASPPETGAPVTPPADTPTDPAAAPGSPEPAAPESGPAPSAPAADDPGGNPCGPVIQDEQDPETNSPEVTSGSTPVETPAAEGTVATDEPAATPAEADSLPLIVPATAPADVSPQAATADAPATAAPADPPEFEIPKVEYRPLDEDLKASIRDELLDQKVRQELDRQIQSVLEEMDRFSRDRQSIRRKLTNEKRDISTDELYDAMRQHNPKMLEQLKELGTRTGLAFAESPLLSMEELTDYETWPIGTATEPAESLFMPAGNSVVQTISQVFPVREPKDDIDLFDPRHAVRNSFDPDGGETHFAWWIVEFSPPHVPKLDDPGIRDQVILTWKRAKALELAKQRGEALAALVREGLSRPDAERRSMAESLEGQTVTGTDTSAVVAVRQTDPFSWYEQSYVPDATFNPRPQLRLSDIRYRDETGGTIRYAGPEFMKSVFDELQNETVGVVMNDNHSSVFVVHVTERLADDDVLKTQFLTEGRRTRFNSGPVSDLVRGLVSQPASLAWEQSIWDKYQARAPELPEE